MNVPLLEAQGLKKSFGGVAALKSVDFCLMAGSVHALCGGNGAGKSTFLSIIMGIISRDAGQLKCKGELVDFQNPAQALQAGISIIEQELSPVPAMSVAENMFLGREPVNKWGVVSFKKMNAAAQKILDDLGFPLSAKQVMMNLTVAQLQLVEIAKALSYDSDIIIMDEPTSALGEKEVEQLFAAIAVLKSRGKGVIYVSHRLGEIMDISDHYTIFRDGQYIETGDIEDVDRNKLIELIVGRPLEEEFIKQNTPKDKIVLELEKLTNGELIQDISLKVHEGEILALYGLMGAGRTEIFENIFGLSREGCKLKIMGEQVHIKSAQDAIDNGLAFVTKDRKGSGLVMSEDVRANICLADLKNLGNAVKMNGKKEASAAKRMIELFSIKTASDKLKVSGLSGGNQQKVVLGKWFLTNPDILLLDEPTRGVDVGAKREIYRVMSEFAENGGTVIMSSSEIDEVLGMADQILVVRDGLISGEISRADATPQQLMHLSV
ncbi:MAG: D-xylose ABC transporter ATP-binding protein [Hyphomicrobiales bacterium]|nr:MAG: D-xylose ABC transporter ATP-binding protein [Hyphomicrobiales bacterium]